MTRYAAVLNPSLTDAEGHSKFLNRLFSGGVATAFNANGFKVTQKGSGANMSVDIAAGDGLFNLPTNTFGYWGWSDATENVTVTAANVTNPRIDVVIAKINTATTTTGSANSPNALEFQVMAGTPSGTPVAMSDSAIQASIGSAVPWIKLGTLNVAAGATQVVNANISDARTAISALTYAALADASITTAKIADDAVTIAKIDFASFVQGKGATGLNTAFSSGGFGDLATPVSVTVTVPASGKVALFWSAQVFNATADNQTFVSYAATGANTIAASDANSAVTKIIGGSADISIGRVKYLTGLTAGSTVFKLQRRNTSGNVTITNADLVVIPVYE